MAATGMYYVTHFKAFVIGILESKSLESKTLLKNSCVSAVINKYSLCFFSLFLCIYLIHILNGFYLKAAQRSFVVICHAFMNFGYRNRVKSAHKPLT